MPFSSLFSLFFRIGAFTFRGGIVMLGFIENELRSAKLLLDEEIADMLVLAMAFPGPIAENMAFLVGKRLYGIKGALRAVIGTNLRYFCRRRCFSICRTNSGSLHSFSARPVQSS